MNGYVYKLICVGMCLCTSEYVNVCTWMWIYVIIPVCVTVNICACKIYIQMYDAHISHKCMRICVCAHTHTVPEGSTQLAQLSLSMHGTGSSTLGQPAGNSEKWVLWHEGQRIHALDLCRQPLYVQSLFPQFEGRSDEQDHVDALFPGLAKEIVI